MAGSQSPRLRICPPGASSFGQLACSMMADYGTVLDEWQSDIMSDWLSVNGAGRYTSSLCALSLARQNGKTVLVKCRAIIGICVFGETILYTAHEVKTARKTFEEMASLFDESGAYPELAAQVDYIRRANGQEEIKLRDWLDDAGEWHVGGRIIFSARSRGAARGFTCDVLILDEAQELTDEQMAALMPVISSGRLQNPQTIMIGTPPAPGCAAEVFKATRNRALSAEPGSVCWHEWSVEEIGDVTDWERVAATNPALDVRLMRSAVEAEMAAMAPDYFARERLGWWSSQDVNAVIQAEKWNACATAQPPADGLLCFAVKFSPDGHLGALSVCLKPSDGKPHVELVEVRGMSRGLTWFADALEEAAQNAAAIVIDGVSNAQPLTDELLRRGVNKRVLVRPKSADMGTACATLLNSVNECALTHFDQKELNEAALGCTRRAIGSNGAWGFESGDGAESAVIESAALALWGMLSKGKDPTRKSRVYF